LAVLVVVGLGADYVHQDLAGRGRGVSLAEANPRERGKGTELLAERFSSPDLAGWTLSPPGPWSVQGGRLKAVLPNVKQEKALAYFGSEQWQDYSVDLDVCGMRGADKGVVVRVDGTEGVGVDLRGDGYDDVLLYHNSQQLGKSEAPNQNGHWHHLRIEARGARYQVFVNGALKINYDDQANTRPAGRLALAAYTGGKGQCEVLYDNVVVRSLN
jgi:hypothetical protein